jgi:hypothetical protein
MSLSNEFQMCLPSNVFGNDKNTPGKYETTLARPLELGGSWECALIDITYPNSWFNIENDCIVIISGFYKDSEKALFPVYAGDNTDRLLVMGTNNFSTDESSGRRAVITNPPKDHESFCPRKSLKLVPAHYDVKETIALLQENIRTIGPDVAATIVTYDTERNRVKISGNKRKLLLSCLENSIFFKLLGYQSQAEKLENREPDIPDITDIPDIKYLIIDKDSPIEANKSICTNLINSIFLYSNITNHVLVGNTQTPLLGYFPVQTVWGQQGYWNFNPPYYLPVKESFVHTIQIRMCKDTGEDIHFGTGTVICRLNFRRVAALRGIV